MAKTEVEGQTTWSDYTEVNEDQLRYAPPDEEELKQWGENFKRLGRGSVSEEAERVHALLCALLEIPRGQSKPTKKLE